MPLGLFDLSRSSHNHGGRWSSGSSRVRFGTLILRQDGHSDMSMFGQMLIVVQPWLTVAPAETFGEVLCSVVVAGFSNEMPITCRCGRAQTVAFMQESATAVHRIPGSDRGANTRSGAGLGKGAEMRRRARCNVRADATQDSSGAKKEVPRDPRDWL